MTLFDDNNAGVALSDGGDYQPSGQKPLVAAALLLIAGTMLGRYVHLSWVIYLAVAAVSLAAAWRLRNINPRLYHLAVGRRLLLAAALVAIAAANITVHYYQLGGDHIAGGLRNDSTRPATITGLLAGEMETDYCTSPDGDELPQSADNVITRMTIAAASVTTEDGVRQCRGLVSVYVDGACEYIPPASKVSVSGMLAAIAPPRNPSDRDLRHSQRLRGVFARMRVDNPLLVERLDADSGGNALVNLRRRLSAAASMRLISDCRKNSAMILNAVVLGNRHRQLRQLQQDMIHSGTAHLLSISGLHLAIMAAIVFFIMRAAGFSPRVIAVTTLIMLTGYLLIVQTRTPLLRGAIMLASVCVAALADRKLSAINTLCGAAAVLLLIDPQDLFRPGFQLSFGVTAGLCYMYAPVKNALFGRYLRTAELMVFSDDQNFARWWHMRFMPFVISAVSASLAAYLASIPLVAYHFGIFTPLAPLATLILAPPVVLVMVLGYIKLLLSLVLPAIAVAMTPLVEWSTDIMRAMAHFTGEKSPYWQLPLVSPLAATLSMAAIAIFAGAGKLQLPRKAILAAAAVLLASSVMLVFCRTPDPRLQLTILDVRDGQMAILTGGDCETTAFDAGSRTLINPGENVLLPMLRRRSVAPLAVAFVSHADSDHYNALSEYIDAGGRPAIYTSEYFASTKKTEPSLEHFLMQIKNSDKYQQLPAGQTISLAPDITAKILAPLPSQKPDLTDPGIFAANNSNNLSLVVQLNCRGKTALLPGDIREDAIRKLLEKYTDGQLKSDVLILPHHGSWTQSLAEFITQVDPEIVIRSSGHRRGGAAMQIHDLTTGRKFYATDSCGAITLTFGDREIEVQTMLPSAP